MTAVRLIRSGPESLETGRALAQAGQASGARAALCFFHGDGVQHALDPAVSGAWSEAAAGSGLELVVCETALARRWNGPLPPFWRRGSLAQFWQALLDSVDIAAACLGGEEKRHALVRIGKSGDELYNREVLELCLAGAALEADMAICFSRAGLELLRGPTAASWRQFPDFELAPLYYVASRKAALDVAARRLNGAEAAQMAEKAGRVIDV